MIAWRVFPLALARRVARSVFTSELLNLARALIAADLEGGVVARRHAQQDRHAGRVVLAIQNAHSHQP